VTDWRALAASKQERFEAPHGALDERALVRLGNTAYAAALALLMDGSREAIAWFRRAAESWAASWELAEAGAWGRPVGILKASLLAGADADTDAYARRTLALEPDRASSPIARYAAVLALLASGRFDEARPVASSLCGSTGFPHDVGDALDALAAGDAARANVAIASVVTSFETRSEYLEDVPVADTALVLHVLGERRGLAVELPRSPVLPGE